jgi:hypothetical protein
MAKTHNSGYSLVATHLTTNPPVRCLDRAERTGSFVYAGKRIQVGLGLGCVTCKRVVVWLGFAVKRVTVRLGSHGPPTVVEVQFRYPPAN